MCVTGEYPRSSAARQLMLLSTILITTTAPDKEQHRFAEFEEGVWGVLTMCSVAVHPVVASLNDPTRARVTECDLVLIPSLTFQDTLGGAQTETKKSSIYPRTVPH